MGVRVHCVCVCIYLYIYCDCMLPFLISLTECVHLSVERIERASVKTHPAGEAFIELWFVYFRASVHVKRTVLDE